MTDNNTLPSLAQYQRRWRRMVRFVAQRVVLRTLLHVYTSTTVEGTDNIAGLRPPFVIVANHCSHLDTVVMVSAMPYHVVRHLAVGAAADHFYTKTVNKLATSFSFNTFPIQRRSGGDRSQKGLSRRLVAEGIPVLIYPEGTRSRDGSVGEFRPGAAALCIAAKIPCVPVSLVGTSEAMPVGRSWPVPGRPTVRMIIGAPLIPGPADDAETFNARVFSAVAAMRERPVPQLRMVAMPTPQVAMPTPQQATA